MVPSTPNPGKILFPWSLGDLWGYVHLNVHQLDYSRIMGTEPDSLYPGIGQGRGGKDTSLCIPPGHLHHLKKDGSPSVWSLCPTEKL